MRVYGKVAAESMIGPRLVRSASKEQGCDSVARVDTQVSISVLKRSFEIRQSPLLDR